MKIFLILIFSITQAFAWEDIVDNAPLQEQEVLFVSLGSHCEVAVMLRENQLRFTAFPLDWLVSLDIDGVIGLLNEDFHDFLNEDALFLHSSYPDIMENGPYKIEFRHDGPFLEQDVLQKMKEKYERRIDRFRQIRNFQGKVFFIRLAYDVTLTTDTYWLTKVQNSINSEQAQALKEALDRYFPMLEFTLIILNYQEDLPLPISEMEGVFEYKIRKSHRDSDYKSIVNLLKNEYVCF